MSNRAVVWFRNDLRLEDNTALIEACKDFKSIIPIYIFDSANDDMGAASKWYLSKSLKALDLEISAKGAGLVLLEGDAQVVLEELVSQENVDAVYWNRLYEETLIERDTNIKASLKAKGIVVESYKANLLFEPWEIENLQKKPFRVFTPFYKRCLTVEEPVKARKAPAKIEAAKHNINSLQIEDLPLLPKIKWYKNMDQLWTPGSKGARALLKDFVGDKADNYIKERDFPIIHASSRLSAALHFGEISPRMIWHTIKSSNDCNKDKPAAGYLRQIIWREFAHHLLYHFPHTVKEPMSEKFKKFPWRSDKEDLSRWQEGRTGYPIVDAGMRELWATGWMHNRVRMIVGSFLVKDLLISWQEGARWFWDTLVDADLANNTFAWQWIGGCGADAAPYFRIFNPLLQGEKFDKDGAYVKKWVPELASLPAKWIHHPWDAPKDLLLEAGIVLGKTYPEPIVNHASARDHALAAYQKIKE